MATTLVEREYARLRRRETITMAHMLRMSRPHRSRNRRVVPQQHWQKIVALVFWLLLFGGYQWYAWQNNLSPLQAMARLITLLRSKCSVP